MKKNENEELAAINDFIVMRQGALISFNLAEQLIKTHTKEYATSVNKKPEEVLAEHWPHIFTLGEENEQV